MLRVNVLALNHMQCIRVNSLNSWLNQALVKRRHLLCDSGPCILFLDETLAILTHLNAFRVRKFYGACHHFCQLRHRAFNPPTTLETFHLLPTRSFVVITGIPCAKASTTTVANSVDSSQLLVSNYHKTRYQPSTDNNQQITKKPPARKSQRLRVRDGGGVFLRDVG